MEEESPWRPVRFAPRVVRGERKTEIWFRFPRGYALSLHVRRRTSSDREKIARGAMVDVPLGDRAFDAKFLVEAAPAAVVKYLLDARARQFLLGQHESRLTTIPHEPGKLCLSLSGPLPDRELQEAIEVARDLAAGVRVAYEKAMELPALDAGGSPYRPEPDDAAQQLALVTQKAELQREVQRVNDLQLTRFNRPAKTVFLLVGGGGVLAFIAALLKMLL